MSAASISENFQNWVAQHLLLTKSDVDVLLAAYLCGTHVLLEGAPGVGKTTLAKAIGTLAGDFGRIQMTSDMTPSDILGYEVANPSDPSQATFLKGPIFHQVVLVDEVNRAMPRCQSALLQAMEEKIVDVAGKRYELPESFFVMATQNPLDLDGTFVLPLSQLDRFGLVIKIDTPVTNQLESVLRFHLGNEVKDEIEEQPMPSIPQDKPWRQLKVDEDWYRICSGIQDYLGSQRDNGAFLLSPRAWNIWFDLGRCLSYLRSNEHLSTSCMRDLLPMVFMHRMDAMDTEELQASLLNQFDKLTGQA